MASEEIDRGRMRRRNDVRVRVELATRMDNGGQIDRIRSGGRLLRIPAHGAISALTLDPAFPMRAAAAWNERGKDIIITGFDAISKFRRRLCSAERQTVGVPGVYGHYRPVEVDVQPRNPYEGRPSRDAAAVCCDGGSGKEGTPRKEYTRGDTGCSVFGLSGRVGYGFTRMVLRPPANATRRSPRESRMARC